MAKKRKTKANKYKVMNRPMLGIAQGLTIEEDTYLIEEFENKELGIKGKQTIIGGNIVTEIDRDFVYDQDEVKGTEKTVIRNDFTVPVGTKLIWQNGIGFTLAGEEIITPSEAIKQIKLLGD